MVKILLFVSLILLIALGICILIIKNQNKKIKIYENELKHLEKLLGAKNEIEKQKEQISTNDSVNNFNASIEFLQKYSQLRD